MTTIECEGWTWESSLGLWYGTGPSGQREQVARPLMSSPWIVVCSEEESPTATFVRIFMSYERAMEYVAQKEEAGA